MSYQRGVRPDYTVGTITLVSNAKNFTTVGASLKTATIGGGDTIMTAEGRVLIISEITGQNTGVLAYPCPASAAGANLPLRIRFQPSSSGVQGAVRDLLERWGLTGNLDAIAGLETAKDMLAYFTGAGTADTTALTEWARTLLAAANGGKGYEALGAVPDSAFPNRLRSNGGNTRTDPNNITESGWYRIAGSNADMPTNATYVLIHYAWSGHQARQLCYSHSVSAFAYERVNTSGTWGPWYRVYSASNILGAVSQDGNVPTGGIIQRGNNANGEFVKFADGTQICTYTYSQDAIVDQAAGVLYMSRDTFNWTFSASFVGSPVGFISVRRPVGTNYSIWSMTENITNTTYAWRILRGIDRPDNLTHPIYLCAIGRWR